ncbi:MAG: hypothetical protein M3548_11010 [Actinomycetota bacterium]|nr:hypothetical protein [Actinomycetota bacterium]
MSIKSYVATLDGALEKITAALEVLQGGLVQTDEARTLLGQVLQGTNDPDAGRVYGEFGQAHNAMAQAYSSVASLGPKFCGYIASITDGQGTSAPATPAPARPAPSPARPAAGDTEVTPERVAELRRELPPDVQPPSRRPRGAPKPKTHGRWIGPDGTKHAEVSGDDNKARAAVDWFKSQGIDVPQRISDVEMKLAVHMRLGNIKEATLVINHVPCPGIFSCDSMVPRILPPGYTMTVHGTNGFSKTYRGAGDT